MDRASLSSGEYEVHLNLGFDLDGLAVQQVRPVLPLLDGFDSRRSECRMTADEFDFVDVALLVDRGIQDYGALNMLFAGVGRIRWIYPLNQ